MTASNSGTGTSIAKTLARKGVYVIVHGRDRNWAEAIAVIGDLSSNTGAQQIADDARATLPKLI